MNRAPNETMLTIKMKRFTFLLLDSLDIITWMRLLFRSPGKCDVFFSLSTASRKNEEGGVARYVNAALFSLLLRAHSL
jgi:hypothetical protein